MYVSIYRSILFANHRQLNTSYSLHTLWGIVLVLVCNSVSYKYVPYTFSKHTDRHTHTNVCGYVFTFSYGILLGNVI